MMGGVEPSAATSFMINDMFALGYLFGFADMASFQLNQNHSTTALEFIFSVYKDIVSENAQEVMQKSLDSQENTNFGHGRAIGAKDFGDWIKGQGAFMTMELQNYLVKQGG